ncbi:MAG: YfcC family protein, partial [Spirochaetaceae bacterium]|nr:YfcC family protein [Spirochaetaceae bacterium]
MTDSQTNPKTSPQYSIKVGKKAFIFAFIIILVLMIVSGILTRVIPAGQYERVRFEERELVVPGSYAEVDPPEYPIWRWATAPVEVLFAPGNVTVITIILFLIFVGGAFTILEQGHILEHGLMLLVRKFGGRRYLLMAIVMLAFMALAAVLGIYESMVPLIVFIVPLAHILGWDSMVGLGMSLLPLAFGFSAAITNPFTIGVAQKIAELPLFSGAWLRIIFFVVVYVVSLLFVRAYARRIDADPTRSLVYDEDAPLRERYHGSSDAAGSLAPDSSNELSPGMRKALIWFAGSMVIAVLFILATSRSPSLSDIAFPLMALLLLIGGVGSGALSGMRTGQIARVFGRGVLNISPGILLILMSLSVKHIVQSGGIMDTLLYRASGIIEGRPPLAAAFLTYVVTLIMNFFVGSASAKAFLMMPILTPLADLTGITRQTAVLAFGFGDGFSNMIYPSNALLIIALGFTVVSYPRWIRWTILLQLIVFVISMVFLGFAALTGFG